MKGCFFTVKSIIFQCSTILLSFHNTTNKGVITSLRRKNAAHKKSAGEGLILK
jgi:hypothetical protein